MIYFIRHTDYVKIGYTSDIMSRLSQLQVSSPVKLKLLGLIDGNLEDESNHHIRFKSSYHIGEWFYFSEEIKTYIDSLPDDLMWKYGFLENEKSIIGEIKKERLSQNLSMEELANKLSITRQAVKDIELREIQGGITLKALNKIAKALNCKFQYRFTKL